MKLFLVALSALLAVGFADSAAVYEAKYYPANPSLRIANGDNALRNQFPYQVSVKKLVEFLDKHICGGAIIAPNWVVSAAHCTVGVSVDLLKVAAGILMLNDVQVDNQQLIKVAEVINHPLYPESGEVAPNDISLLRLVSNLNYGINVQPIGLPQRNSIASGSVDLSGWGRTKPGGYITNHLQWVQVPILPISTCKTTFDALVGADQNTLSLTLNICTGVSQGNASICDGDSGNPIAQNNTLQGIATWGASNCDQYNTPSVYANVAAYIDWIEASTNGTVLSH